MNTFPAKGSQRTRVADSIVGGDRAVVIQKLGRVYSGMLPCFFGGFLSRLFSRFFNAVISLRRVSRGRMTSSTKPRDAAMYGFANFSRNSSTFSDRACTG